MRWTDQVQRSDVLIVIFSEYMILKFIDFIIAYVNIFLCLSVSIIMQKLPERFSLNLVEVCGRGQRITHYILGKIR